MFVASNNRVFKIQIFPREKLGLFIKEPLYMLSSKYCNTPSYITVYCKNENNCNIDNILINNYSELNEFAVITWYEEMAIETNITRFAPRYKKPAQDFMRESKLILSADNFIDLSDQNVGLFSSEPLFRWIDIMPNRQNQKIDNCLYTHFEMSNKKEN